MRMRRGRLGSNQYRAAGAPPPTARADLPNVDVTSASTGDGLERAAWTFAPDADGAWAWAFPESTEVQQRYWRRNHQMDALQAIDAVDRYTNAGVVEDAGSLLTYEIDPVEALRWEAAIPGKSAMTMSLLRDCGLTPDDFSRFHRTGRYSHIRPAGDDKAAARRRQLNIHSLYEIVGDWHDPHKTVGFIAHVSGMARKDVARSFTDSAMRSFWRHPERGDEDARMYVAAAMRPRWAWSHRLRQWWSERQAA